MRAALARDDACGRASVTGFRPDIGLRILPGSTRATDTQPTARIAVTFALVVDHVRKPKRPPVGML